MIAAQKHAPKKDELPVAVGETLASSHNHSEGEGHCESTPIHIYSFCCQPGCCGVSISLPKRNSQKVSFTVTKAQLFAGEEYFKAQSSDKLSVPPSSVQSS